MTRRPGLPAHDVTGEGARGPGRRRRLTDIAEWTRIGITTCVREAENRQVEENRHKSAEYAYGND